MYKDMYYKSEFVGFINLKMSLMCNVECIKVYRSLLIFKIQEVLRSLNYMFLLILDVEKSFSFALFK